MSVVMKQDPQEALATLASDLVVKKLEHLPIVKVALDRLDVAKTIDELVPPDPRNVVTTGECVEALVTTILMGCHTLYQVADTLEPFDCELAFSWGDRVQHFTDERLAKALDHVFRAGVPNVNAAFLANAIRAYGLDVSQSHFDTTSIKTYGDYYFSEEPDDPEDPQAIPHVTRGHSKDKRPDLKQILYGLTVSGDGGVPFVGRVASGNRSDVSEVRFNLRRLAEVLPNPSESLVVGDSKTFSGETFLLYRENNIGFVTLFSKCRPVGRARRSLPRRRAGWIRAAAAQGQARREDRRSDRVVVGPLLQRRLRIPGRRPRRSFDSAQGARRKVVRPGGA